MSHKNFSEVAAELEKVAKNEEDASTHNENHSPLSQFEVKKIVDFKVGSVDLSFTNFVNSSVKDYVRKMAFVRLIGTVQFFRLACLFTSVSCIVRIS